MNDSRDLVSSRIQPQTRTTVTYFATDASEWASKIPWPVSILDDIAPSNLPCSNPVYSTTDDWNLIREYLFEISIVESRDAILTFGSKLPVWQISMNHYREVIADTFEYMTANGRSFALMACDCSQGILTSHYIGYLSEAHRTNNDETVYEFMKWGFPEQLATNI